jgi:predicted nucleotidyltransferase
MNETLLDLSGKIDGLTVELLKKIADVAESMNVPFFIVGAIARDIILSRYYDIETGRATQDIDLAVQVSDWNGYERLRQGLIASGKFMRDKKIAQGVIYKEFYPVDIIPFGAISEPNGFISWPHDDMTMNTLGFREAYNNSITVRMQAKPAIDIQFVSLPGLALLKMISWDDNPSRRDKDAPDLLLLMRTYLDAGNQERLWNKELDLIVEDFDYVRAGAKLLGRDIARILSPDIKETIVNILNKETEEKSAYGLVENMLDIGADSSAFDEALQLLEDLKAGILEIKKPY